MGVGSYDCNPCLWVQAFTREHPKVRLIEAGLHAHTHIYAYIVYISADVTTHELLLCSLRYEERRESLSFDRRGDDVDAEPVIRNHCLLTFFQS